jgi:hypothetical protein
MQSDLKCLCEILNCLFEGNMACGISISYFSSVKLILLLNYVGSLGGHGETAYNNLGT